MKQIILNIPDKKYPFFMELMKNLDFIELAKAKRALDKKEIVLGLREAVQEVKAVKSGRKKAKSLREFLDEL